MIDDARNDQLSSLTTFDMHSVASEIFQMRLNQALELLDGLLKVHDDMVMYGIGKREEEATTDHNVKLKQFLQQCKKRGVQQQ